MDIKNLLFYSHKFEKELTIKEFLKEILRIVWKEDIIPENYFLKYDLVYCLVKNGIIFGIVDEKGNIFDFDRKNFNEIILKIIKEL